MTAPRRDPERLLPSIRACLALVLLTPLAWAPWTLYPFPVGKAVYARTCIAAAFALWTVLALLRPCWRPPRSALLAALLAGLAAAVLSACFGVSPQHSLWSTYTRMQGSVNAAHWIAFAVVVASVMRTSADWTRLLNLNLAVGLAVSLLAILRFAAPETPLPLPGIEGHWPRIGASAGNPILLGAYLQATALLAAGFLVRTFCGETAPAARPALTRAERRRAMHRQSKAEARAPRQGGWSGRLFWTAAAGCALAGVALTGSLGALAGLAAGAGAASALYALYGRARRSRRLGLAGLGAVGAVTVVLTLALALRGPAPAPAFDNPMLERATSAGEVGLTLGNRLRNWEAGMRAFAERPLLGWGTDNYFVASARHLTAPEGRAKVRDHAHNLFVEEAASRGVAGLAAWLALWGLTGLVVLRAARRLEDPRERALAVFAGAALAGWFVQGLTSFYSAGSWLQHMLLLGFLVQFESRLRGPQPAALRFAALRRPAWLRLPVLPPPAALRALGIAAAFGLAAASVASSASAYAGAAAMWRADNGGPFVEEVERAIDAFAPLATGPRIVLFNNIARNWEVLARGHADEAVRLLGRADVHAAAALAAEPQSWVLHHALARLYLEVAAGRPEYAERAQVHLDRSLELAPNLDPMEAPEPPAGRRAR